MAKAIVRINSLRDGRGGLAALGEDNEWREVGVLWFQDPVSLKAEHEASVASAIAAGKEPPKAPVKVPSYDDVDVKRIAVGSVFPKLGPLETAMARRALDLALSGGTDPMVGATVLYTQPVLAL